MAECAGKYKIFIRHIFGAVAVVRPPVTEKGAAAARKTMPPDEVQHVATVWHLSESPTS